MIILQLVAVPINAMKHSTACAECRSAKRKCMLSPKDPDAACLACQKRRTRCSWSYSKSRYASPWVLPKPHLVSSVVALEASNSDQASPERVRDFIRLYFRYIHDRPHSLFHEQSMWRAFSNGSLPESLCTAICALGCRFAEQADQRDFASSFRARSKALLAEQLEDISVANIQTCILLANSYAAEQNNRLEALYFGIANRMAYVLGLHERNPNDTPILRETKSRIWWSLFVADKWCPPGLGLPYEIRRTHHTVDPPIDEVVYQAMQPVTEELPLLQERKGFWAYMITLADILSSIQDVNRSLVRGELDRPTIDQQVNDIGSCLLDWHNSLPQHMVMNNDNLKLHQEHGHGGTFIALHFGYHHYSTLLYFQYLEPNQKPTDQTATYASRCSFHGLAFSRLLHTARQSHDCHVVYLTVAHMTIVSSSVLLHMLLLGDDTEVETARKQLTLNFEALQDLTRYWPCVEHMKKRLFVFQDACLRSSAATTYIVDRWMVRFLLEYGLPLEEKSAEGIAMDAHGTTIHNTVVSLERRAFLGEALESVRN